jgi:hypothetical protein
MHKSTKKGKHRQYESFLYYSPGKSYGSTLYPGKSFRVHYMAPISLSDLAAVDG